jgi:hypothetical protein
MSNAVKGPDTQLSFSMRLASQIGVDEAILYQALIELFTLFKGDIQAHSFEQRLQHSADAAPRFNKSATQQGQQHNCIIPRQFLENKLPFWQTADLQRLLGSLSNRGSITQLSPPLPQVDHLDFCFGRQTPLKSRIQPATQSAVRSPQQGPINRALPISPSWRPNERLMQELAHLGINLQQAEAEIPNFVHYYREKGELGFNWAQKFKDWLRRTEVRIEQPPRQSVSSFEQHIREPEPMTPNWKPEPAAINILLQADVDPQFIEDTIPEFILYWRERGEVHKTWSSKFIAHTKRQWLGYQNKIKHSRVPQPITSTWQPDQDVFDILKMAYIDESFARQWVQEFVLYWRDSGTVHTSWNSKYLQFVKQKWSQRLEDHGASRQASSSRHGAAANTQAQLSDTSWAE